MAVVLALGLLAAATPAWAAIDHYDVDVAGLACPFCAYGLEKKLKNLPGVKNLRVDLDAGRASFDVAPGTTLMPRQVRDAVKDAGFTPGTITVRASGTLQGSDKDLRLALDEQNALDVRGGKAVDAVKKLASEGKRTVIISGPVKAGGTHEKLRADAVQEEAP